MTENRRSSQMMAVKPRPAETGQWSMTFPTYEPLTAYSEAWTISLTPSLTPLNWARASGQCCQIDPEQIAQHIRPSGLERLQNTQDVLPVQ